MPGYGYSTVTDKGFNAFMQDLAKGAWKDVSIKRYDTLSRMPSTLLVDAPLPVVLKVRAVWAITSLKYALGGTEAERLDQLDAAWEAAQNALHVALNAAMEHPNSAHQRAAERLREAFRAGSDSERIGYGFDEAVDFGRYQISSTESGSLAEDTLRIGIGPQLKGIHEATEALARAIGRAPGRSRSATRSRRISETLSGCATSFNAIHEELNWLILHTPEGEAKRRLEAMRAPFIALLTRFAPRAAMSSDRYRMAGCPTLPYVTHAHV